MSDPVKVWVPAKRFGVKVVTSLAARRRKKRRKVVSVTRFVAMV